MRSPVIGELILKKEPANSHDEFVVAVIKDSQIVGHISKKYSQIMWYFITRGDSVICHITGRRRKGKGLTCGSTIQIYIFIMGPLKTQHLFKTWHLFLLYHIAGNFEREKFLEILKGRNFWKFCKAEKLSARPSVCISGMLITQQSLH